MDCPICQGNGELEAKDSRIGKNHEEEYEKKEITMKWPRFVSDVAGQDIWNKSIDLQITAIKASHF
ncbi:hypothetical protein P7H20_01620 [Paenibacillus larvae]|nr:hypothetical protein [Paenibacillus larvae]MDT2262441.1 hypothetical protein [Paenibacillus larvae]MDT2273851.1 hypothetical protein [Paenibacillus larvae]MDT2294024.1 hypothetical protein [Paenibacillus larvae]